MRRPATHRQAALVAGAALVALVAAVVVVRSRGTADPPTATAGVATPGAQPAADGGSTTVTTHTHEEGAVAAALGYAGASQRWLYLDDEGVAAAVEAVAAPGSERRLSDDMVKEVRAARDELAQAAGRIWWFVRPLAWRVESLTSSEATVAVWAVTVLSAAEVAVPQAEWTTVTVDLEWSGGAWLVSGVTDRPGPTPVTGPRDEPWDAVPFDDALDGFTRLGSEGG